MTRVSSNRQPAVTARSRPACASHAEWTTVRRFSGPVAPPVRAMTADLGARPGVVLAVPCFPTHPPARKGGRSALPGAALDSANYQMDTHLGSEGGRPIQECWPCRCCGDRETPQWSRCPADVLDREAVDGGSRRLGCRVIHTFIRAKRTVMITVPLGTYVSLGRVASSRHRGTRLSAQRTMGGKS
jgi:hypothetical protein